MEITAKLISELAYHRWVVKKISPSRLPKTAVSSIPGFELVKEN